MRPDSGTGILRGTGLGLWQGTELPTGPGAIATIGNCPAAERLSNHPKVPVASFVSKPCERRLLCVPHCKGNCFGSAERRGTGVSNADQLPDTDRALPEGSL